VPSVSSGEADSGSRFSPQLARRLLGWHRSHTRDYPWRHTTDPYRLTITELMLVRTRADQVAAIWPAFFASFPTLEALAVGDERQVMDELRPLGLRWRAQRIIEFAKGASSVARWQDHLERLPGGGPYVAAAVSIGTLGRGALPVDVTIARVLARYGGIDEPGEPRRNAKVLRFATELGSRSRRFFHAWLDLAAQVCVPRRPRCPECPLRDQCVFAAVVDRPSRSTRDN
jgi:A/G-specific adenine glycosylase